MLAASLVGLRNTDDSTPMKADEATDTVDLSSRRGGQAACLVRSSRTQPHELDHVQYMSKRRSIPAFLQITTFWPKVCKAALPARLITCELGGNTHS